VIEHFYNHMKPQGIVGFNVKKLKNIEDVS